MQLSLHNSKCAVCCILLLSLFTSRSTVGIFPHALSNQSKSSLGNAFKDTSSQQVKRMLSRNCILVHFSWFRPQHTVWCEKEPKRLKIATMYNFWPLVRTKASEPSDFPGVNTPLNTKRGPEGPSIVQGSPAEGQTPILIVM